LTVGLLRWLMLSDNTAKAVANLAHHEDFPMVWQYFKDQAALMQSEVLDPATDAISREFLVRVLDVFKREVIELPDKAVQRLNQKTPDKP